MKNGSMVQVSVSVSWYQVMDTLVRSFERNAEHSPGTFARNDAAILRHIADMIDELVPESPAKSSRYAKEEARPHAAPDNLEGAGGVTGRD